MTPLLELQSVTAGYGDATVLWDVSLAVHPGEVVAIVGANGAGKSTLLSCVAGLVRPSGRTRPVPWHRHPAPPRPPACPATAWPWCPRAGACSPS